MVLETMMFYDDLFSFGGGAEGVRGECPATKALIYSCKALEMLYESATFIPR